MIWSFLAEQNPYLCSIITSIIREAGGKLLATEFDTSSVSNREKVVYSTFANIPIDACMKYAAFLLVYMTFLSFLFLSYLCYLALLGFVFSAYVSLCVVVSLQYLRGRSLVVVAETVLPLNLTDLVAVVLSLESFLLPPSCR